MTRKRLSPNEAARDANIAADQSLEAAQIAQREAKKTAAAKREIDARFPSEHEQMVQALATAEQSAYLRIGPRRNRWKELAEFEEQLAVIEQRRAALLEETSALNLQINSEPERHTAALAAWLEEGEKGDRPASRLPELQTALADRQAEYDALGKRYNAVLVQRAEHVAKNRGRFKRDVEKAKNKAARDYGKLIDAIEAKRAELLDLRATEVWAGLFPSELLSNQANTQALVGAKKGIQEPLLPGVQAGLIANGVFELLRADVWFCSSVATVDQFAALEGKTTAELTGRDAQWLDTSGVDFVGPRFDAAWAGSPEAAEQASRIERYTEAARRRVWGDQ